MPWIGSTSMLGRLRAASLRPASISAPSMISALSSPSLEKLALSALVLPPSTAALSITTMPPSLALAESACLSASARTFLGRSIAWLRTTGPNERPPPRNRLARAEPWRAPPVPFCAYIFLPVRQTSARFWTACVPARRLASCHLTQRCRMSTRGSRPKIASDRLTDPASAPSKVVIFNSISRPLFGFRLRRRRGRRPVALRQSELAGLRRILRQRLLHRVAHRDPAALRTRHRALDQDEAALDVGLHHLEIERGDPLVAELAGHLLVLEHLAGVLAVAGRAERAVRHRHAVRRAQAAEIPPLHRAGETLADRGAGHVDELADHEVVRRDLGADRDQRVVAHAKLGELALGLDLGDGEVAALGLRHVVDLAGAGAELERDVAVLLLGAMTEHLALGEAQHRDGHMLAGLGEDPRHPQLLCDHSRTHRNFPWLAACPQSLISTSTPAARSSFISASTVCGVGSTMSSRRLWVRISNCSRLFLSMCGERLTVNFSILVGNGMGPRTCAPVRLAVATISRVEASRMRWSNAFNRMRMFWPFMAFSAAFSRASRRRRGAAYRAPPFSSVTR